MGTVDEIRHQRRPWQVCLGKKFRAQPHVDNDELHRQVTHTPFCHGAFAAAGPDDSHTAGRASSVRPQK